MIAGQQIKVGVPHEEGTEFTLRSLGHKTLRDARNKRVKEIQKEVSELDISNLREALKDELDKEKKEAEAKKSADTSGDVEDYTYDTDTVLEAGIVSWSYELDVTPASISELDPETAEWAFKAIIDMSRRKTADRKN